MRTFVEAITNMGPLRILIFVACIKLSIERKLPSNFNVCKYSTDKVELGECMKKEYVKLKPLFATGLPELHISSFEPYVVEKLQLESSGNNNAMSFNVLLTNMSMYGTKDMVIEKLLFDIENAELVGETYFPYHHIVSKYQIKGNILVLPLDSSGNMVLDFTDIHTKDRYSGKRYTKNGKEYIKFDEGKCEVTIKGMNVYFDNLINGNAALTNSTNAVLNDNAPALIDEFKVPMAESHMTIRLHLLNTIFTRVPLDELFN